MRSHGSDILGRQEGDILIVNASDTPSIYAMTNAGDELHDSASITPVAKQAPAAARTPAPPSVDSSHLRQDHDREPSSLPPATQQCFATRASLENGQHSVHSRQARDGSQHDPLLFSQSSLSLRPEVFSLPMRSSSTTRSRSDGKSRDDTSSAVIASIQPDQSVASIGASNDQQLQDFATTESGLVDSVNSRCQSPYNDLRVQDFEECWMLNMSIQFRDRSGREKFFVTYAEGSNAWRRLTISVKYVDAPPDSLETELHDLQFQRDKSHCIFDALRESLPTIQFFDTVTNLKLVTDPKDGQLHVHVREDTNEAITFPASSMFEHVLCPRYREGDLMLHSHISGFVYRVAVHGRILVKKDIPGRESVEEFMYELNALNSLHGSPNVIELCGLVTNENGQKVKGLLIQYAEAGSLADILYEMPKSDLSCERREKWARQITAGLADIHEAGFVQGDFTLTNIVVDQEDNAKIIDINRRGCPIGWEPPELMPLIEAGQKISMYISAKTDLYQLGMVLSALANHDDDPNQYDLRPLKDTGVSLEYQKVVSICLNHSPRKRLSASQLVSILMPGAVQQRWHMSSDDGTVEAAATSTASGALSIGQTTNIDPALTVTIEDVHEHQLSKREMSDVQSRGTPWELRNSSFESRASSTHQRANSELWSTPRSRGRTLQRHPYRVRSESRRTTTSETSISSLSTQEGQGAPVKATSIKELSSENDAEQVPKETSDARPLYGPQTSAQTTGDGPSQLQVIKSHESNLERAHAPSQDHELPAIATKIDPRRLHSNEREAVITESELDQLQVDQLQDRVEERGPGQPLEHERHAIITESEPDRLEVNQPSENRSQKDSDRLQDQQSQADVTEDDGSRLELRDSQSGTVGDFYHGSKDAELPASNRVQAPEAHADDSGPCMLCFRDSGFDELLTMVSPSEHDTLLSPSMYATDSSSAQQIDDA